MNHAGSFNLSVDELRWLGHALGWVLDGQYERSERPKLSLDRIRLRSLHYELEDMHRIAVSTWNRTSKVNDIGPVPVILDDLEAASLATCLRSICVECATTPTDIEVIFGCGISKLERLADSLSDFGKNCSDDGSASD